MKAVQKMILVTGLLVLLSVQACAPQGEQTPSSTPPSSNTSEPQSTPPPGAEALVGREWKWVMTQMNDGLELTPRDPDAFTLRFAADGSMNGTTDCNSFFGQYQVRETELTFGPIGSTKMFCENSQESEFLRYLGEVGSYMIEEDTGRLVLMVKFDSGSIILE